MMMVEVVDYRTIGIWALQMKRTVAITKLVLGNIMSDNGKARGSLLWVDMESGMDGSVE